MKPAGPRCDYGVLFTLVRLGLIECTPLVVLKLYKENDDMCNCIRLLNVVFNFFDFWITTSMTWMDFAKNEEEAYGHIVFKHFWLTVRASVAAVVFLICYDPETENFQLFAVTVIASMLDKYRANKQKVYYKEWFEKHPTSPAHDLISLESSPVTEPVQDIWLREEIGEVDEVTMLREEIQKYKEEVRMLRERRCEHTVDEINNVD